MGIVLNQSFKNTLVTYLGFTIGAINTLYLYIHFLGDTYYGLVGFLLSTSNILMPIIAFGMQNTLVKFFNEYDTRGEKKDFLSFILWLPIPIITLITIIFFGFEAGITSWLSRKNDIVKDYVWMLLIIGSSMAYFEIFYSWLKIHFKTVLGNFLKEVFIRIMVSCFLLAIHYKFITPKEFLISLMFIYLMAMLIMAYFAFKECTPSFKFKMPQGAAKIITFSLFIILTGGIANLFLEIDKFMLNGFESIENIAYYSVAVFITTVIAVPSRAMHQITYPITAKWMSEEKWDELDVLYKKTSITLQIVGGLIFVGIISNLNQLYVLLPEQYSGGVTVVFAIGLSKYFDLCLGNNNAIIFNSKYYKIVLALGLVLLLIAIGLNMILIPAYGLKGTAFATLISITLYSFLKLLFVIKKMKLFPFSKATFYSFGILIITFFFFYFWDFSFHPFVNIFLKSILITIFYLSFTFYMKLSDDINNLIKKWIGKII